MNTFDQWCDKNGVAGQDKVFLQKAWDAGVQAATDAVMNGPLFGAPGSARTEISSALYQAESTYDPHEDDDPEDD